MIKTNNNKILEKDMSELIEIQARVENACWDGASFFNPIVLLIELNIFRFEDNYNAFMYQDNINYINEFF